MLRVIYHDRTNTMEQVWYFLWAFSFNKLFAKGLRLDVCPWCTAWGTDSPVLLAQHTNSNISKLPIVKLCKNPWFLHLLNFAKINLKSLAKLCKTIQNFKLPNHISAKAYLQKLAKIQAFSTHKTLLKHYLQKPICETLWKPVTQLFEVHCYFKCIGLSPNCV